MDVGIREDDEIAWLCQHGYLINIVIGVYRKITIRDGMYVLLSGSHERHLRHHEEEVLDSAETFQALLKKKAMKNMLRIARWQWFLHENEEIPQNT
jgi:hypothetical protein